jgi:hypothetical protein
MDHFVVFRLEAAQLLQLMKPVASTRFVPIANHYFPQALPLRNHTTAYCYTTAPNSALLIIPMAAGTCFWTNQ